MLGTLLTILGVIVANEQSSAGISIEIWEKVIEVQMLVNDWPEPINCTFEKDSSPKGPGDVPTEFNRTCRHLWVELGQIPESIGGEERCVL